MLEQIRTAITEIAQAYRDTRVHFCRVEAAALIGDRCRLTGAALSHHTLAAVSDGLAARFPQITFDISEVEILHTAASPRLTVATNVTGLHAQPSFQSELVSQLLNGWTVDLLKEEGRWVFVSVPDHAGQGRGYLGWAYRPYLTDLPAFTPTHIVCEPVSLLRAAPAADAPLITRIAGGTAVHAIVDGDWAWLELAGLPSHPPNPSTSLRTSVGGQGGESGLPSHPPKIGGQGGGGWVRASDLRDLSALPPDEAARRAQIVADAARFIGVPYLWGGCTALGIDCSGFAQMLYRLIGIAIPRDADMQYEAGIPIEPPFRPGDLLFFGESGEERKITHVGVSLPPLKGGLPPLKGGLPPVMGGLGGWRIIHSSRARNGVYEDDVQMVEHLRTGFIAARTFLSRATPQELPY